MTTTSTSTSATMHTGGVGPDGMQIWHFGTFDACATCNPKPCPTCGTCPTCGRTLMVTYRTTEKGIT